MLCSQSDAAAMKHHLFHDGNAQCVAVMKRSLASAERDFNKVLSMKASHKTATKEVGYHSDFVAA